MNLISDPSCTRIHDKADHVVYADEGDTACDIQRDRQSRNGLMSEEEKGIQEDRVKSGTIVCRWGTFMKPYFDDDHVRSEMMVSTIRDGVVWLYCSPTQLAWWQMLGESMWIKGNSERGAFFNWSDIGVHTVRRDSDDAENERRQEAQLGRVMKVLDVAGGFADKRLFIPTYVLSPQIELIYEQTSMFTLSTAYTVRRPNGCRRRITAKSPRKKRTVRRCCED